MWKFNAVRTPDYVQEQAIGNQSFALSSRLLKSHLQCMHQARDTACIQAVRVSVPPELTQQSAGFLSAVRSSRHSTSFAPSSPAKIGKISVSRRTGRASFSATLDPRA